MFDFNKIYNDITESTKSGIIEEINKSKSKDNFNVNNLHDIVVKFNQIVNSDQEALEKVNQENKGELKDYVGRIKKISKEKLTSYDELKYSPIVKFFSALRNFFTLGSFTNSAKLALELADVLKFKGLIDKEEEYSTQDRSSPNRRSVEEDRRSVDEAAESGQLLESELVEDQDNKRGEVSDRRVRFSKTVPSLQTSTKESTATTELRKRGELQTLIDLFREKIGNIKYAKTQSTADPVQQKLLEDELVKNTSFLEKLEVSLENRLIRRDIIIEYEALDEKLQQLQSSLESAQNTTATESHTINEIKRRIDSIRVRQNEIIDIIAKESHKNPNPELGSDF